MAITDYIRQGRNGQVTMMLDELPEIGFIDAIKTKNICKAEILKRQARAGLTPGSPDVKITSASGETLYISRRELKNNFLLSNGSKIRVAFLNAGKDYTVYSICNEQYKVIKLPDNCTGNFQGKRVRPGSYMICKVTEDGSINMSSAGIVSPKLFKKMFVIPPQDVIKRHLGSGNKEFTLLRNGNEAHDLNGGYRPKPNAPIDSANSTFKPIVDTSQLGIKPSSINIQTASESLINNRQSLHADSTARNDDNKQSDNNDTQSKYKYTAINRVVDMNHKMQGFTLKEIQSGRIKQITTQQMVQVCSKKLVDNIILAKRESTGTIYLKGNGIIINNLPEVLM